MAFTAKLFDRSEQLIRRWCRKGRFAALNIPVYQDSQKRWWISISEDR